MINLDGLRTKVAQKEVLTGVANAIISGNVTPNVVAPMDSNVLPGELAALQMPSVGDGGETANIHEDLKVPSGLALGQSKLVVREGTKQLDPKSASTQKNPIVMGAGDRFALNVDKQCLEKLPSVNQSKPELPPAYAKRTTDVA